MPVKTQPSQVRMLTVFYTFQGRLPLLYTICLYRSRLVPLRNLEHPLNPSTFQKHPVYLLYPQGHSPVLGCEKDLLITSEDFDPTRKQFIEQKSSGIPGISNQSIYLISTQRCLTCVFKTMPRTPHPQGSWC